MHTILQRCALLALLAASPSAQVFGVFFQDEDAAKGYRKSLVQWGDEQIVACEAWQGLNYDPTTGVISYPPDSIEVLPADPEDPAELPYELEDGRRVPKRRGGTLSIQMADVSRIDLLIPGNSLYGLAHDYAQQRAELDELEEARDDLPRGGAEWNRAHLRLLSRYSALRSWLARSFWTAAVEDVDKEIERQRRRARRDAPEERLERALASVRAVETPEALAQACATITGGELEMGVVESEHLRIVHDLSTLPSETAQELATFAERIIETFRRDHVDPYLSEEFPDHIPDHAFLEFWIGPDRLDWHEAFYVEYYGETWGDNKEERLRVRGSYRRRADAPEFLDYGKREDHELYGVVTHRVGHVLSDLHYNAGVDAMKQDWLEEAVGYAVAFEHLGRNEETCYSFQAESRTRGGARVGGEDPRQLEVLMGERWLFNELALDEGRPIERLLPVPLWEMGDADLAKAWSFYDYLAQEEGVRGQQWLRAACELARSGDAQWVNQLRERGAALFEVEPARAFSHLEERWRAYAEDRQWLDED